MPGYVNGIPHATSTDRIDLWPTTSRNLAQWVDENVPRNDDPRLTNARPPTTHTHPMTDVTGLQTALNGKTDTTDPRLSDARPPTTHTHPMTDVTGLQTALDGKARKEPIDLADQNLNDVIDEGPYVQTSGAAPNAERNYPASASGARQAGLLEVTSRPGDYLVFQRYTTFNGGEMFFRARYGGTWYAWERAFRAAEATPMQAQLAELAYKSGRRNITSLFTPAPASGAVYLERRGGTVWLHVDAFVPTVTGDTLYSNVIPTGFQIAAPAELPASPRVPTDPQGNFRTYSHVLGIYRQESGRPIRGLVSWPTDQAIPATLPGTPA